MTHISTVRRRRSAFGFRGDAGGCCDIRGAAFLYRKPRAPAEKCGCAKGAAKPLPAGFSIGVAIAT
jgi:hypothetical protein